MGEWLSVPVWCYVLVAIFGALAGIGELISRYQDAPLLAIKTAPGVLYLSVNGAASILALAMGAVVIEPANQAAGFSNEELLQLLLIAGFGSLAFFRAKVVTLRVGDNDVGVGPSFILETVLRAADRAVDRVRAEPRATTVSDIMQGVAFEESKVVLPAYCFALMQNVTVEEQQKVALEIDGLTGTDMPDRVKALSLGLLLLNIVGERVLTIAVEQLRTEFTKASEIMVEVQDVIGRIDFERAALNLTPLCAELAEMPDEARESLEFDVQRLRSINLTDQTRRYLFGLLLIRTFGIETVRHAMTSLGEEILDPRLPPQPPRTQPAAVAQPANAEPDDGATPPGGGR